MRSNFRLPKQNRILLFITLAFIFTAGDCTVSGSRLSESEAAPQSYQSYQSETQQATQTINQTQAQDQTWAERVIRALAEAYPRQIDKIEFRNGDWALLMRGTWYYYANGRILPENYLADAASYGSVSFYNYPAELPQWTAPSAEESARLRETTRNLSLYPPRRSSFFLDDLWRMHNRAESYDRVKSIRFLGITILVHYMILENLSLIEEEILTATANDPQVMSWKNSIGSLESWNWRNIAETESRSYHAYGLAIDLLPRSLGGKETYWLWASNRRTDWWNVSYSSRFHPPNAVIKIFEKYGFIWGGKWQFYDTMHFEYRPEILILNGMPPETRR